MPSLRMRRFERLFSAILFIVLLSGCGTQNGFYPTPNSPETIPLSKFILGTWIYQGKTYYEGYGYSDVYLSYTFQDDITLQISTGEDGGTCTYKFTQPEVVLVDCRPRALDLRQWSVKRQGEYLLIQEPDSPGSLMENQLRFTRVGDG